MWPQSTAEGSRDPNPSRGCRPSLQRTHHPGEGTRGSIWEEQAGRDPRHPSASAPRSSEQRHVRAIQQQESLADHRQPHSVLPTAQGECCGHMPQGGTQGVPEQGWGRKRPSDHWALWPSPVTMASLPTLSISLALFSHSPTSRPLVSSSWLSSMLTWAPTGSGEASSRPGMTDVLFPRARLPPDPEGPGPKGHLLCSQSRP